MSQTLQEAAGQRLLAAIDAIDEDVALVELWACALCGFAHAVPDYAPRDITSSILGLRAGTNRAFSGPGATSLRDLEIS